MLEVLVKGHSMELDDLRSQNQRLREALADASKAHQTSVKRTELLLNKANALEKAHLASQQQLDKEREARRRDNERLKTLVPMLTRLVQLTKPEDAVSDNPDFWKQYSETPGAFADFGAQDFGRTNSTSEWMVTFPSTGY